MTEIFVGVDTNILINFGRIEDLKWRDLFPGVTTVNMLISTTVQTEMDEKKDTAKGYAQKRAKEYQRILTSAEETENYAHSFLKNEITVNVHFLAPPKPSDLDTQKFELENSDSRIVAEYYHYQGTQDVAVTVLSNDARTIREGKTNGMTTLRPRGWEEDRREFESDNERRLAEEVRELKRQLGARPKVGFDPFNPVLQHPTDDGSPFDWNAYLISLGTALKDVARPRTVESLIEEYGIDEGYGNYRSISTFTNHLTPTQVSEYQREIDAFFAGFEIPALEFLDRLKKLGRVYVFDFAIRNEGTAPEEMLFVELHLDGAGVFVEPDDRYPLTDWRLTLPEEPRPPMGIFNVRPMFDVKSDSGEWSPAEALENSRRFQLQSLLHGHTRNGQVYILPKNPGQDVKLRLTLRAKGLLEPICRQITLRAISSTPTNDLLDQYICQYSVFVPDDQRDLLRRVVRRRRQVALQSNA